MSLWYSAAMCYDEIKCKKCGGNCVVTKFTFHCPSCDKEADKLMNEECPHCGRTRRECSG